MQNQERRLRISGVIEEVRTACDFAANFVLSAGLGDDIAYQCDLSIEEVCTNIIKHGYKNGDANRSIEIICQLIGDTLQFTVIDTAPPFNPLVLADPDPDRPLWEREGGGWGIFIVKKYMTEIAYRFFGNRNHLILTKKLN